MIVVAKEDHYIINGESSQDFFHILRQDINANLVGLNLKEGNSYNILKILGDPSHDNCLYVVINELGIRQSYFKNRFIPLEISREEKLNKILKWDHL